MNPLAEMIIVILLCILLIIKVESGDETVECGQSKNLLSVCFKDLPPEMRQFLYTTSIPVNEKEILSKCTVFRQGISCFERYSKKCIDSSKVHLLENSISGAKNFLNKLCEDKKFQSDYLRHKDCFIYIQDDWKRCTANFQNLLVDELNNSSSSKNFSNRFMQFCCSRYAYENCVFNSAKYKCHKNSAKFVRTIARLLLDERHFRNCRHYEDLLCTSRAATTTGIEPTNFLFLIVSYKFFINVGVFLNE